MKRRMIVILLLPVLALLSGCDGMLERSSVSVTPHVQFSDESANATVLRAETYQGLVSALLHVVGRGETNGVIRLYQYVSVTGSAASDVDRACLEVTKEDPLGAYAVDYIKYAVHQTASYYEIEVKLAYTKSKEQINDIISVTGSSAIGRELKELLPGLPEEAVFRISYFTADESAETIQAAVQQAVAMQSSVPQPKQIQVRLYPDQGVQRMAEIRFTWPEEAQPKVENFLEKIEK